MNGAVLRLIPAAMFIIESVIHLLKQQHAAFNHQGAEDHPGTVNVLAPDRNNTKTSGNSLLVRKQMLPECWKRKTAKFSSHVCYSHLVFDICIYLHKTI